MKKKMYDIFKETMLPPQKIVELALTEILPDTITPAFIKENFSEFVDKLQLHAYGEYLKIQKQAGEIAIKTFLGENVPSYTQNPGTETIKYISEQFEELDKFYLSISQSRKQRAGGAFEDIIKALFKKLNYPFDEQIVINGKPDFLMPGELHYKKNAMDCIIFTAKRTLRERWRQIVTEGTRGLGFFLATIDQDVSAIQLEEMRNNRIYLVVPVVLKNSIEHYSKAQNVISFETFFLDHLDPAVERWHRSGVI